MASICGSYGLSLGTKVSFLSSPAKSASSRSAIEQTGAIESHRIGVVRVNALKDKSSKSEEEKKKNKPSLFTAFTDALDFSSVRSDEDAELLEDARNVTKSGEKMSREQYGALRRKIGGTYRDFFKDFVEVDGEYVDEGWVDKTCRVCRKNTSGAPRTVDKLGRYAHVACLENQKTGNFFSRLFSK